MNLGELRTAIDRRSGVAADESALNELVNDAIAAISAEGFWNWLHTSTTFATVAGTGTQALPSGWKATRTLQVNGYEPMTRVDRDELDRLFPDTGTRGLPYAYAVDGSNLLLRPVPDAVYTVTHTYQRTETALSGASDEPLLPAQYHRAVVEHAVAQLLDRAGQARRSEGARRAFDDWLLRIRRDQVAAKGPQRIRVRPGGFLD